MTNQQAISHLENMKRLKGYDNTSVGGVPLVDIIDDIIFLLIMLQEQEPLVMTAEAVQEDELVWIEVPQSDEIWPALLRKSDWFDHPTWVMRGYALASHYLYEGYGRDWRCWTARPTDEQREAVKWDE